MVWVILLAILIIGYYFIIKRNAKITEKYFSLFSLIFAALAIIPILSESFSFVLRSSLFLPFVFGLLGIILGWFGMKGDLRISLIGLNSMVLVFYLIVFLMATVGFQEP